MLEYRTGTNQAARRETFIGGSDARIIMGDDQPALLGLWREKRGEVEPEDLSGNLIVQLDPYKRLSAVFDWRQFPEPHSWPSSILVDELDASGLQSQAYLGPRLVTAAQGAVLSLQPLYRRNRYVGCSCQLFLRPSQKCTRSLNLPDRYF